MNVGRKLMLIVVTSVILVTIPAAGVIYLHAKQKFQEEEAITLVAETNELVTSSMQNLLRYELSLKALTGSLKKSLSEPAKAGETVEFNQLIQHYSDGAWRNKAKGYDGRIESGLFLPPDAPLDAEQKLVHLRSKRIIDIFSASITTSFDNIWLLTKGKTEIIYDHLYPDFVSMMSADTDYTQSPWLTLGDPATNPERGIRWTPPLFDPVPKSWMVSVISPIDLNGRWIGNLGRDINIEKAIPELLERGGHRYPSELRFLLDAQGNYIDAGPWQKQLESQPGRFKPDLSQEPELTILLMHKVVNLKSHYYQNTVTFQGNKYLAIDAPMPSLGWRYTRLVPIDEILAPLRKLFYELIGMVLVSGVLVGFLIEFAVKRNIVDRMQRLAQAVRSYGAGEVNVHVGIEGDDEIAKTSQEFDLMTHSLRKSEHDRSVIMNNLPITFARVDNNFRYEFVSDQYTRLFGKSVNEIVGHTMREIVGEELYKQEEPYLERALEGQSVNFEVKTNIQAFGEMFGLIYMIPNFDEHQKVDGIFISVVDITERKRAQEELLKRDARWKFAIEGFGDCLWDVDEISKTIIFSDAWYAMIGFSKDEISNKLEDWESRIHHDDSAAVIAAVQSCHEKETPTYIAEYRTLCKDGSYKWILDRGIVMEWNSDNKALRMVGTSTDISRRKQLEHELSVAATAFESQEGIMITDVNKIMVRVNTAFTNTTGYSAEEAIGQSPKMLSSGRHDSAFYRAMWDEINSTGTWAGEVWNKRKNGEIYPEMLTISTVKDANGNITYYVGSVVDITERKKTEQELIESEFRWKFAIEGAGDGVWDVNVQTNEAKYSKRWKEMLGYHEDEIVPNREEWITRIHPEDKDRVLKAGQDYFEGKTGLYVVEYRLKCKDDSYKWMLSRGMVVSHSFDGRPLRMIGTQEDINDRKLSEEKLLQIQQALQESHERYVDLYEFAPLGYLSITKHGMIAEVNWKVTAMLGLARKLINDRRFEEFVAEDQKDFWRRQFTILKNLQEGEELVLEINMVHGDGSIFNAKLNCLRMDVEDDLPILRLTIEDVTQLKKADEVLKLRESYQRSLLDNFPFMVWLKDSKHRYLAVNQAFAKACGYASQEQIPGKTDLEVLPKNIAQNFRDDAASVIRDGKPIFKEDLIDIDGMPIWFETYKSPVIVDDKVIGTVGFARDINDRKQAENFEKFRSHILGLLIEDHTLHQILEAIALDVEQFNSEMLCSILLLDIDGKHLINIAAPSLPTFYNVAIDGLEIADGVGSCSTAAYTGKRVIVEDIATNRYWEKYKDLAASSGLAACTSQPIFGATGKILGTFAIYHREVHKPTEAEIHLIEQSANLASIAIERKFAEDSLSIASIAFESQEGMMVTDAKNIILKVNKAFSDITGYTAEEAIGHTPRLLSSSQHTEGFYDALWECVHATGHWAGEVYNRRKNGEVFPQHLTVTEVKDTKGVVTNHVATLTDITMNKAAAEEIKHLAFYDSLTGLPNRRLMVDRLNQALVSSARTGRDGAVLFLDLDHFKTLNDSLGHDVGDLLLRQVAERLTSCVREGDTVARLGGDEYVVLLEDLSEVVLEAAAQVETIGEKILKSLNHPYQLGQHEYNCTPSIGAALFNNHNQSQEELLKHADIAMYQAKKAGRNTIRFFDPKMQDVINTRVDLERELRKALDKHQLHLYYQIQVDATGRAMGAEALIRWLHPEHGLVSPFHFIPLAEETGLIISIGKWVLDTACSQLKVWEQQAITRELTISINVSAKQFRQPDFVNQVNQALLHFDINPMRLKLELTESMLLDNIEDTVATMNQLKEIGIRFSLDDFGTGYSSLQYLKRLPLYQLKIDQSFVRDIAVDSSDQAIVRTIIAMAHTLNLNVIAEGVETEEQQDLLLNNGCTHYQGYLFGRPVPIEQFEVLISEQSLLGK